MRRATHRRVSADADADGIGLSGTGDDGLDRIAGAGRTPWHQDSSYLAVAGPHLAVAWTTFDPVAKEDGLEFVRGSHKGRLYNGSRFELGDDTAPTHPTSSLPRLPDIEADRAAWDLVSWAVEPGDLIVFHPAMLHGGAPTHPGQRRRTLTLRYFGDQSVYVTDAVSSVVREGVIAAVLTAMMILLFLGSWRSTLIVTISIPLAILAALTGLSLLGETINVMTLGGLALAVGILVDDATVNVENINRHIEMGAKIETAILDGASEIIVPATV